VIVDSIIAHNDLSCQDPFIMPKQKQNKNKNKKTLCKNLSINGR
jgi:hypothetical protein